MMVLRQGLRWHPLILRTTGCQTGHRCFQMNRSVNPNASPFVRLSKVSFCRGARCSPRSCALALDDSGDRWKVSRAVDEWGWTRTFPENGLTVSGLASRERLEIPGVRAGQHGYDRSRIELFRPSLPIANKYQ